MEITTQNALSLIQTGRQQLFNALMTLETSNLNAEIFERISSAIVNSYAMGGKVVFTGVGKNAFACQKLAATFNSLSLSAIAVSTEHLLHGDFGAIDRHDIVIGFSKSGNTLELTKAMGYINSKRNETQKFSNVRLFGVRAGNYSSNNDMNYWSEEQVIIGDIFELDDWNTVPTISALALQFVGDCIAILVARQMGLSNDDFLLTHPGGTIGGNMA